MCDTIYTMCNFENLFTSWNIINGAPTKVVTLNWIGRFNFENSSLRDVSLGRRLEMKHCKETAWKKKTDTLPLFLPFIHPVPLCCFCSSHEPASLSVYASTKACYSKNLHDSKILVVMQPRKFFPSSHDVINCGRMWPTTPKH